MQLQQSRFQIGLLILALVFVTLLIYSTAPRIVQAATGGFTQTQAYSSNFTTKDLPTDGTTQKTLTKIPFTVPSAGKVEVTATFAVNILGPTGGCNACHMGTLSCSLTLDGSPILSLNDLMYSFNLASQGYAMTTTTPVIAGAHTVALLCTGLLNPDYVTFTMQATGRGMSAIVLY